IASTQEAVDERKNSLTTGTLTASDIKNSAVAHADNSGFGLASDMFTQGKYGVAKAGASSFLLNASDSESASGVTHSAVGGGRIEITDEDKQQALTGQTTEQSIANLNRDTASANQTVERSDVDALVEKTKAEQAIKTALYNESVKFTDEAYRKMFLKKAKIYVLEQDTEGNIIKRLLSDEEKLNLQPGADGKIHIADNGIFNDLDAAAKYALQHGTADGGPQYMIYFEQADNAISELMIAGYQKFMEGNLLGLTNATQETLNMMQLYGQDGLHLDGHSRGSMTIGNAMEAMSSASGSLSGTTVNFFGPAYNAQQADDLLSNLQNRPAGEAGQSMVLQYQNHYADPVGLLIGGNPATGGTIPNGSNVLWEMIWAATGQENTSHNSYGNGRKDSKQYWNDGLPVLVPVSANR
ncbi:MAG: adhesin, partial [Proteobacteria bacterium]|nr:adhesin [Pseudomonadota bacterium]